MENIETIEQELICLIDRWTGSRHPITPLSALYHDLHVAGDDLYEFFLEVTKRYGTCFKGFQFSTYVPDEPTAIFYYWATRLGICKTCFRRLTIKHLAAVIQCEKWFEPDNRNR
jgi:hypothetical protein